METCSWPSALSSVLTPREQLKYLQSEVQNKISAVAKKERELQRLTRIGENEKRNSALLREELLKIKKKLEALIYEYSGSPSSAFRLQEIQKILAINPTVERNNTRQDIDDEITAELLAYQKNLEKLREDEEKKDVELARVQRIVEHEKHATLLLGQKVTELKNEYSIEKKRKETLLFKEEVEPVKIEKNLKHNGETLSLVRAGFTAEIVIFLDEEGDVYSSPIPKNRAKVHNSLQLERYQLGKHPVVGISCGSQHTALLTQNHELYVIGTGPALGLGREITTVTEPTLIKSFRGKNVNQVSCGGRHTLALVKDRELYGWGPGKNYRLGNNSEETMFEPKLIQTMNSSVRQIATGWSHSLVLLQNGILYTFGKGSVGQCGTNQLCDTKTPFLVKSLSDMNVFVKFVDAGYYHTSLLTENGEVYTFGGGTEGQLGHSESSDPELVPKLVTALNGKFVTSVKCGAFHTIVQCASSLNAPSREVFVWGKSGQSRSPHPMMIESLRQKTIIDIACGINSSVALLDSLGSGSLIPVMPLHNSEENKILQRHRSNSLHGMLQYGVISLKGERKTLEDRYQAIVSCEEFKKPFCAYFGLFDGYGGDTIATTCQEYLHKHIMEHPSFDNDTIFALKDGFLKADKDFLNEALEDTIQGGSTATTIFIIENKLIVANVGDSEAVLCRSHRAITLTTVHTMKKNPKEEQRIKQVGGVCYHQRLGHTVWNPTIISVAVSRAMGDLFFKSQKYTNGKPTGLIAEPDVTQVMLTGEDQFLILACDGLWDVITAQQAVDYVINSLKENNGDVNITSSELASHAMNLGSLDNITVLIVLLRNSGS